MNPGKVETAHANKTKYLVVLLVLAGIVAYMNSFSGPFIFDDEDSVPGNPYIRNLWPADYLFKAPRRLPAGR